MTARGHLMTGMMVGAKALTGFEFDPNYPFAACRLCGSIFQARADREEKWSYAHKRRHDLWRIKHTRQNHTLREVNLFRLSGLQLTPEAAHKLAPFGVIPVEEIIFDDEIASAMREAPRAPTNDAEGT